MTDEEENSEPLLAELIPLGGRPGPAARISQVQAEAIIAQALGDWQGEHESRQPSSARRAPRVAWAAVVLLTVAGSAAAAHWYSQRQERRLAAEMQGAIAPTSAPASASSWEPLLAPAPQTPGEPASVERREEAAPSRTEKDTSRSGIRSPSEDLLERANRLRSQSRWREAERAYTEVYQRYPATLSAYVARVAAASLELDHLDNPEGARRALLDALASHPNGALDVEIHQALVEAARRRGDRAEEIRALRRLIENHGQSLAAEKARLALEALERDGR